MSTGPDCMSDLPIEVQDYLQKFFQRSLPSLQFLPFRGGCSSAVVWKVIGVGQSLVLRVEPEGSARLNSLIATVSDLGLSPHLHYQSSDGRYTIMDFFDGAGLCDDQYSNSSVRASVHNLLKELSLVNISGVAEAQSLYDKVKYAYVKIQYHDPRLETLYQEVISIQKVYPYEPICCVHGDLSRSNLLVRQAEQAAVVLIDWQESGVGESLHDIASLANELGIRNNADFLRDCGATSSALVEKFDALRFSAMSYYFFWCVAWLESAADIQLSICQVFEPPTFPHGFSRFSNQLQQDGYILNNSESILQSAQLCFEALMEWEGFYEQ